MISRNGPMAHHVYSYAAIEQDSIAAEIPTKFCSTTNTGGKSPIYVCLVAIAFDEQNK